MAIGHDQITQLWHAHAAALTLLARARCEAAEDCVQEAFIKLTKLPQLPHEPIAWLSQVVRREAISHWRSESRRQHRESIASMERQRWFESADANRCDLIDRLELQHALQCLEPDDREILVAHLWTGLTFRQIAEAFEMPLAQVHRRYTASMTQLKSMLDTDRNRMRSTHLHPEGSETNSIPS